MKNETKKNPLSVKQDSEKPVGREVLATAIVRISEALHELKRSGINERAIVALVHDHSKLGKREVQIVLDSLAELRDHYCSG